MEGSVLSGFPTSVISSRVVFARAIKLFGELRRRFGGEHFSLAVKKRIQVMMMNPVKTLKTRENPHRPPKKIDIAAFIF